ncbi:cytochrome-c oxidase, cbb3-type subunit III [Enterovirga sp. CN4-39]|uniref:cytochrome-c oxidase, cbb3-type subunit III n=1 Tax=Enterovirga sp. CN4-39 TaxID=3400910 RepID=UPI003C091698
MAESALKSPDDSGETTGHEWDGIRELNNPLPRWWLYSLYATIIWAFGYWVAYPAWPLVSNYTTGLLGYSQRELVLEDVAKAREARAARGQAQIESASWEEIRKDPNLLNLALATGKAAFGDNCAGCHGTSATGRTGYPNLQDDEWLWGGTLPEIEKTIRFGARTTHPESHAGEMMAFGRDGILKREEIRSVANYVLSLSGKEFDAELDLGKGAATYAQNCAACHGDNAKGNREVGAPDLTDPIWLYGSSPEQVIATITNGRKGVMPAWEGRLDEATIRSLAVYVHSLGGGR